MQTAGNKLIALIVGALATVVVFGAVVLVVTRSPKITNNSSNGIINAQDLSSVNSKTANLNNFGDLPITVTSDQIGRDDPFAPY